MFKFRFSLNPNQDGDFHLCFLAEDANFSKQNIIIKIADGIVSS